MMSLPMVSHSQETVTKDLKYCQGYTLMHHENMCIYLSAVTFVPNQNKDTIVGVIFFVLIII